MMRIRFRQAPAGVLLLALAAAAGPALAQDAGAPLPPGDVGGSAAAAAAAAAGAGGGSAPAASARPAAPRPALARMPLPPRRPADLDALASRGAPAPAMRSAVDPALDDSGLSAAPAPAAAAPPAPAPEKVAKVQPTAVDTSPRAILDRVNASLNAMNVLQADFVQTSGNGRRSEGRLYVLKPGRLRFEYDPPNPVEIVADGSKVAIRDRKLNTQDVYPIGQTPLKFLLKEDVDIARDTKVVDVDGGRDLVSVTVEDRSTFGGTSRVELRFDPRSYQLRQWTVTDPQGYQTTVALKNASATKPEDPFIFSIDYTRLMGR
jgi:outer membrane lipoprotein-sorting protein